MEKITLKELYLQTYTDTSGIKNYPLYKLLCEESPFIFNDMMYILNDNIYDYPLLKTYLTQYTAYNHYSGLLPATKVNRSTILDLILLQTYGNRTCNVVIDEFRYNYMPFKDDITRYSLFSNELSFMIINRFAERWEKYLQELTISYNPIHNYDMVEDEKVNSSVTVTNNTDRSTNGFNSSVPSLVDKDENTVTTTGDWDDNKRNLTRSGNIGVTTSQQMLESEIKLRDENIFIKRILEDVANYITVGVYD